MYNTSTEEEEELEVSTLRLELPMSISQDTFKEIVWLRIVGRT